MLQTNTDSSTKEALISRTAERVTDLRLEAAVCFLLEAHLPLVSLLHTAGLFLEPFAAPFLPRRHVDVLKAVFSDRQSVEELIKRIEELSAERTSARTAGGDRQEL